MSDFDLQSKMQGISAMGGVPDAMDNEDAAEDMEDEALNLKIMEPQDNGAKATG
jgi:hypothetical protein